MALFWRVNINEEYILILHDSIQFSRSYDFKIVWLLKYTTRDYENQ